MTFTSFLLISLTATATFVFGQDCSNASLSGPYAYAAHGTVTVNSRTITNSEVGRFVFDGKGAITGVAAVTSTGTTVVGDFTGAYAVGSDCTVTGKTTFAGVTTDFDAVVVSGGSDFVFANRDGTSTLSGAGTKIEAQGACSAATLSGAYGYQGDGSVMIENRVLSLAEVGVFTFNGRGGVTGVYSASAAGLVERMTFSGTYEIGANCTGNMKFKVGDADYVTNFAVASAGNTVLYSEVGPNTVITGQAGRTFLRP